jgi:hypothetical protein
MNNRESTPRRVSRRDVLAGTVALAAGSILSGTGVVRAKTEASSLAKAPPLPWQWVTLDPAEAGRRAYHLYFDKGGCGTASYLSILSMLQEEVGHPWTSLPDMMMIHAAGGYGGHGTLCGALGGASCVINLVAYRSDEDTFYKSMIDWLYSWYAQQEFPTGRFDDISKMPDQVRVKASSPLCHTSVTSWTLAANEEVNSTERALRRPVGPAGVATGGRDGALRQVPRTGWHDGEPGGAEPPAGAHGLPHVPSPAPDLELSREPLVRPAGVSR